MHEDFRARALREGLRYGEDRLVFVRELAQNARDAGASRIDMRTALEGRDLVVDFTDDGSGMSYEHARRYLFTLYASSKEGEERSAGRFGVGFWSVLLFSPDSIVIESMTAAGDTFAICFDGRLEYHSTVRPSLSSRGTKVRLRRLMRDEDPARIIAQLEDALRRYCGYLRRNDKAATALAVSLNGARIDRPFKVDGPCWMAFRDGSVEGAVGLGQKPLVELYARGLLVWHGTTIDELRYGATPKDGATHPDGLAPVYVINGNDLSVTMDRRAVVDDAKLARVRRIARRRMRELVGRYLDGISKRPFLERLRDLLVGLKEDFGPRETLVPAAIVLFALLAVGGALGALRILAIAPPESAPVVSTAALSVPAAPLLDAAPAAVPLRETAGDSFNGPMVEPLFDAGALALSYRPADEDLLLRTIPAELLHAGRGVTSAPPTPATPATPYRCASGCVDVEVALDVGAGPLSVPTPTGYRVEPASVLLDGAPKGPLLSSPAGQPVLLFDTPASGRLGYRVGPATEILDPARWNALLTVPTAMRLPPAFATVAATAAARKEVGQRVAAVTAFVREAIAYDRSEATSRAFRGFMGTDPSTGWVELVTSIGRGDCDVKNTLAVLMLRRAGVPARLAVGFAAERGAALPGMHAWVEYWDGTWMAADATGDGPMLPAEPSARAPDGSPLPPLTGEIGTPPLPSDAPPAPLLEPVAPSPTAREEGPFAPWIVAVVAGIVAVLFGLVALALFLARPSGGHLNAPGGGDARRRIAAQMLCNAVAHPGIWLADSGLATRRLLPVLGRAKGMSLSEAKALAAAGRLWHSKGGVDLVREAVARGTRVLDASDPAFAEIVTRLLGGVDLDELAAVVVGLGSQPAKDLAPSARLVEEVDLLVCEAGLTEGTITVSEGLVGALSRDVDLTGLRMSIGAPGPRRRVVVSPSHPDVARLARAHARAPSLAAFMLLDRILEHSELLAPDRRRLRRITAAKTLEAAP